MRRFSAALVAFLCLAGAADAQLAEDPPACRALERPIEDVIRRPDLTDARRLAAVDRMIASIPSSCPILRASLRQRRAALADDAAWRSAQARNTLAAYDAYLAAHPDGRHQDDARLARERETPANAWRRMAGDWRKLSGAACSRFYRIAVSGGTLTRAFYSASGWGTPTPASRIVNNNTVAFGATHLRLSGPNLHVTNPNWRGDCRFVRGAPAPQVADAGGDADDAAWRIAQARNTIGGYQSYLSAFPDGRHADAARAARYALASPSPSASNWRKMAGDWRRVSGSSCSRFYRIEVSGPTLTRAFYSGSGWGRPAISTAIIDDDTVAFGATQLRFSDDRIFVSNPSWSSGCEFVRGAPAPIASSSAAWRGMVGDWRRVSGAMCSRFYRIALSDDALTRAFYIGSRWGAPSTASRVIDDRTVAFGATQLRLSGGRIRVTNPGWSSGCEFVRGAPTPVSTSASRAAWRGMVGDWRRVSGAMCSRFYRIGLSGNTLTRAFYVGSSWRAPERATAVVDDAAVAFGETQLRLSSGRIRVTNPRWSSGCEFVRGAPASSASSSATAAWRGMVGDWRRLSGAMCSRGYRIALVDGALTRAFYTASGWGAPAAASHVVDDRTVAWGTTQLRYSGGHIYVTNPRWSSGCEFVRGAPTPPDPPLRSTI